LIVATHGMSLASSSFTGQALAFRAAVQRQQRSPVAQVVAKQSRIGKLPVIVPDKVQVTLDGNTVKVKVSKIYTSLDKLMT
jgi:hypothetical protein